MHLFLLGLLFFPPEGYVTDKSGILTNMTETRLEYQLRDYEVRTGNQLSVVIVKSLGGRPLEEYANLLFHEWGIGQKGKDNGILLLWSTEDRKVRLEVGYGLEGDLPDGKAGEIIRETILPYMKRKEWDAGVSEGVNGVISWLDYQATLRESPPPASLPPDESHSFALTIILLGFVTVGTLFGLAVWSAWMGNPRKREYEWVGRTVYPDPPASGLRAKVAKDYFKKGYEKPVTVYLPQKEIRLHTDGYRDGARPTPKQLPLPALVDTRRVDEEEDRKKRRKIADEDDARRRREESLRSTDYVPSTFEAPSFESPSVGFGGGDSGGGGATGDY